MAWIESHTVLSRHRKVKDTARALRIRPAYLIGHLHLLWHAALEQAEDGDLTRWSDEFIAEAADFPGDAPQFVRLLRDHGWLDGRLLHDWTDYAGKYLIGKYAKDHRDRLVEIWAKHGKQYGKRIPKDSPTDSQLDPNQTPRTLLGRLGKDSDSSPPGGDARGGAGHVRAVLAGVDPGNLMPAPPDPPNIAATRATLQAHHDRAKAAFDAYPLRSKDGRAIRKDLAGMNLLAARIASRPDFPWEEAAELESLNDTPQDLANWLASQPDPVMLETRRKQKAAPPAPGERPRKTLPRITA